MIWMTWRQLRASAVIVFGVLALTTVALAATGPRLADLFRDAGESFFDRLSGESLTTTVFYVGTALVYALPAVIGAFWGAPMVAREVEAGTHRLVWNQSITRTRWLTAKLGLTSLVAVAAGTIGLALAWWAAPVDDAIAGGLSDPGLMGVPRLWPVLFGARGVVPIGMAVLALVVGVTAGLLLRRTVPAMAVTLAAVAAVQVAVPLLLQPHLLPAQSVTTTITAENLNGLIFKGRPDEGIDGVERLHVGLDDPGAWITESVTVDRSGEVVTTLPGWVKACAPDSGPISEASAACFARLDEEGYHQRIEFHPASDFWALQWVETGVLLVVALGLAGFCFWRTRRDLT